MASAVGAGCATASRRPPPPLTVPAASPSRTEPTLPTTLPSQTPAPTETPTTKPEQTPVEGQVVNPGNVPAQLIEQAREDLARRLSLPAGSFAVTRSSAVEWPDSSLGCPQPGFMYSQIVTPGYLIVLAANGREYEYHTDRSRAILCEK